MRTGDVCNATLHDVLWISSEKMLRTALSAISEDHEILISTVEINLSITPPINLLNRLLKKLSRVDTVTIRIPFASEELSLEILHGLEFPRLQFLATSLHHGPLVDFIRRHPRITSLYLGICGSKRCPIPPTYCSSLSDISGPTSCLTAAIRGNPLRAITAKHHGISDVLPPLYLSMRSSTENITQLQLDFPSTDCNILRSIRLAAPRIMSLKLTEILNVCDQSMVSWIRNVGHALTI